MIENEQIVEQIVEGIHEKKGKKIVIVNLNRLNDAPCAYFVICEGDSVTHTGAVAHSIEHTVHKNTGIQPYATDGFKNSEWIALDYGQIIVHVFQRHSREFYDLEHLWNDAEVNFLQEML